VACVGPQEVTEAAFKHWSAVAQAEEGPHSKHKPSAREVTEQVMGFLISADWVRGEAADLKVHVSSAIVQRRFHEERQAQFPEPREFRKFLRESKQTVADLLVRVELDILSERIQQRVTAGHKSASSQARALKHFVNNFRPKWTAKTYCAPQYAVDDCGHVQVIG
jgi:hypothetical protein